MAFDVTQWKNEAIDRLRHLKAWLARRKDEDAPYLLYGYLCGLGLWPLAAAAQAGELLPAMMALGSVAGGVGGNLLANQLQGWKERAGEVDPESLAGWVVENVPDNDELRQALDDILEKLALIEQARAGLDKTERQWFEQTLQAELAGLGNLPRFEASLSGKGAIAQGKGSRAAYAGRRGIAVAGDVGGDVVAGDKVGRDQVGRDKIGRDKVGRDKYEAGQMTVDRSTHIHPPAPDPARQKQAEARARYLQQLSRYCQALPLAALGGEEGADEDLTLDRVYIQLDTTATVPLDDEETGQEKAALPGREAKERPLPALAAARQTPRLALLGDPGAGKSTFARHLLAWQAAANLNDRIEPPPDFSRDLLPVLITLRDLAPRLAGLELDNLSGEARQAALAGAVREQAVADLARWNAADFAGPLQAHLTDGRCLLVLDGLDEVPHDLRRRVRQAAGAVIRLYQAERMIVTCRVRSYVGETKFPGFEAYTLAPFNRDKIRDFATAWYQAQHDLGRVDAVQAKDKAEDLSGAALGEDLRELSENPMLLTTMALIHQREIGLPRERVRLFSLAVAVLLSRWQKRKTGEAGLAPSDRLAAFLRDEHRLRQVLERLAYEAHRAGRGEKQAGDLARGQILALLEAPDYLGEAGLAAEFLDYVDQRAGLLVGRGGDAGRPVDYSFPHRTFQEYLAGCYLIGQRQMGREFYARAGEGDYWALAAQLGAEELLYNARRDHELLDLAYYLCPQAEPANEQDRRATLWAGNMALLLGRETIERDVDSPGGGGPAYLKRLIPRLAALLASDLTAPERAEAGRALAGLGDDPRPGVGLREDGLPDIVWREVEAGPFLMGSDKEKDGEAYDDELPQHMVELPAYKISQYPVTQAHYRAFVEDGGYARAEYWAEAIKAEAWDEGRIKYALPYLDEEEKVKWRHEWGRPLVLSEHFFKPDRASHPIGWVNWYEALAFCRWLTAKLQEAGEIEPDEIVLLPSEAEWEKAARGPSTGSGQAAGGRLFPWGNEADSNRANYRDTGIGTTSAAGCFPQGSSPYGVQEMSGNVWEWTRSLWGKEFEKPDYGYPYDATDGRENLEAGIDALRVLRGGSFNLNSRNARCASRVRYNPDIRLGDLGFRVVLVRPHSNSGL